MSFIPAISMNGLSGVQVQHTRRRVEPADDARRVVPVVQADGPEDQLTRARSASGDPRVYWDASRVSRGPPPRGNRRGARGMLGPDRQRDRFEEGTEDLPGFPANVPDRFRASSWRGDSNSAEPLGTSPMSGQGGL
jgi:hypothetical protein